MQLPYHRHHAWLTPKDDTAPVRVYVKRPRGTLYWGGAGLDGDYIEPQVAAFAAAGMGDVHVGSTNTARMRLPERLKDVGTFVDALRAGLPIRYEDDDDWTLTRGMEGKGDQFNLVGYSYGSLLAAQTANTYARQLHVVHHLVLIGSPIDAGFLDKLKASACIRKVLVLDLKDQGDPLYAGMTQVEILQALPALARQFRSGRAEGHFYYAQVVRESPARWKQLAETLYRAGLR